MDKEIVKVNLYPFEEALNIFKEKHSSNSGTIWAIYRKDWEEMRRAGPLDCSIVRGGVDDAYDVIDFGFVIPVVCTYDPNPPPEIQLEDELFEI